MKKSIVIQKNYLMMTFFMGLFFTEVVSARSVNVQMYYACLGVDNVPIPYGASNESCCDETITLPNGNHPLSSGAASNPACMAGFTSIGSSATQDLASSLILAQNALQTANELNGTSSNFNGTTAQASPSGISSGGGITPVTSAMTSGGSTDPGSSSATTLPSVGSGMTNGNGGGAAGGAGLGGSGQEVGSASLSGAGSGGTGNGSSDNGSGANTTMAYVSGSGSGDHAGSGFPGFSFGSSGKGAGGVGHDGMDTLNLGDGANASAHARGAGDDEGSGVAEDPADYFKRTNKSTNLFVIVSKRYFTKKSLWK